MARVPTIAEEDTKRPNRERDCLVGERTRIVNRIKSTLARLGIRNFKPTLRKAAEVCELLPARPITRSQVELMECDNIASPACPALPTCR
jgi:transposase